MNTYQQPRQNKLAPGALLPSDPNKAMQAMMDTIDRLRGVYEKETEALLNVDTKGFLALQDDKHSAATEYKDRIEELLTRKNELRDVEPQTKQQLARMQADFSELTHQNMQALDRMKRTMDRLSGTLRSVAKDAVKKQRAFSYDRTGHIYGNEKKRISTGSVSETA